MEKLTLECLYRVLGRDYVDAVLAEEAASKETEETDKDTGGE